MEFFRYNSQRSKGHISLECDTAVCGANGLDFQANERLKSLSIYEVITLDYPAVYSLTVEQHIDCKKCIKWYYKNLNKYLNYKL